MNAVPARGCTPRVGIRARLPASLQKVYGRLLAAIARGYYYENSLKLCTNCGYLLERESHRFNIQRTFLYNVKET